MSNNDEYLFEQDKGWQEYFSPENEYDTLNLIKNNPSFINESLNGIQLVEFLIQSGKNELLKESASFIDLSKPASDGKNLFGYWLHHENNLYLNDVLSHQPSVLNQCGSDGIYNVQYLIDKEMQPIIMTYSSHLDFSLPATGGNNLMGHLIKADMPETLNHILEQHAPVLNQSGKNGIINTQYLIDYRLINVIRNYSKDIDLTLNAMDGKNILSYLINADMPNTLKEVLKHQPEAINQCGKDGIYPVEYMVRKSMPKTLQEFSSYIDLSKPASDGRNLLGYLIKSSMVNVIHSILEHDKTSLNMRGKNQISPVQYMIDARMKNTLACFSKDIDFLMPATGTENLLSYLKKSEMSEIYDEVIKKQSLKSISKDSTLEIINKLRQVEKNNQFPKPQF